MSLDIVEAKVTDVLLADGWHHVEKGSFGIDSYEYSVDEDDDFMTLGGGRDALVPSHGFGFRETVDGWIVATFGPLTAILAVRTDT